MDSIFSICPNCHEYTRITTINDAKPEMEKCSFCGISFMTVGVETIVINEDFKPTSILNLGSHTINTNNITLNSITDSNIAIGTIVSNELHIKVNGKETLVADSIENMEKEINGLKEQLKEYFKDVTSPIEKLKRKVLNFTLQEK